MNRQFHIVLASASAMLLVLSSLLIDPGNSAEIFEETATEENLPSWQQLHQQARSITVKVISGQTWGSGILIQRQDSVYTIVTNQHVLVFGQEQSNYQVETPDGRVYRAQKVKVGEFGDRDLGVLQFTSEENYEIASLSSSSKAVRGETVYAAGFPFEDRPALFSNFSFNSGTISMLTGQTFAGGYQIGYTNDVRKGMSGGPLFNRRGEIVGINGVHKYPLWGNPYVFQDGSAASQTLQEKMSQLSWAIPMQTVLQLAPQFAAKK
jgi:serine protease Do